MSNVLHTVQSRLKHRKVLGVGESADGKFPRSKICQLLGNDHLNHIVIEQGGYPRGLRLFQWLTCILFGVMGVINILFPQHFYRSVTPSMMDPNSLVRQVADDLRSQNHFEENADKTVHLKLESHIQNLERSLDMLEVPVRLYGTACLSLSALFFIVAVINKDNRRAIRIALYVEAMYFIVDILGYYSLLFHHGNINSKQNGSFICRLFQTGSSSCNLTLTGLHEVTIFAINPLSTENTSWLTDPISLFWLTMYKVVGTLLSMYYSFVTHPSRDSSHRD